MTQSCLATSSAFTLPTRAIVNGRVEVTKLKSRSPGLGYGNYAVIDEIFSFAA